MGAGGSRFSGHLELLDRFAGTKSIAVSDTFWRDLLTFPTQLTRFEPALLQEELSPTCHSLVSNNHATLHFPKLLVHLLRLLAAAHSAEARAPAATNALLLARAVVMYATEHLQSADLAQLAQVPPGFLAEANHTSNTALAEDIPLLHQFVAALLVVVSSSHPSSEAYLLQLEACNLLIALMSTQLYTPHTASYPGAHPFTESIMEQTHVGPSVVQTLLSLYCTRPPLPAKAPLYVAPPESAGSRGSTVVRFVRSAAASVLWLPYHALSLLLRSPTASVSPLADTGELLLLLLVCHSPATGQLPPNVFRAALQALQDCDDLGDAETGGGMPSPQQAVAPYCALYETLGRRLTSEKSVLLLYLLLHGCRSFQEYALVRSDPDTVVVPLLRQLHVSDSKTASHTYMLLIIILIFSQDGALAANVHQITLPAAPWYRQRYIGSTTLGSLMVVVLLRTAHSNLAKLQDVYLQTNTLAALANLAPFASNLSSHASQRMVALFDVLARRYRRLLRAQPAVGAGAAGEEAAGEVGVYAEFLRVTLEIINCVLSAGQGPASNPQLVYSLLHRQEVFAPFGETPEFKDVLSNIFLVVDFFNGKVEEARHDAGFEWSVEAVLRVIKTTVSQVAWSSRLRMLPDLRFEYAEAETGEDFFVPFVWSLAVASLTLPWRHSAIILFTPMEVAVEDDTPATDRVLSQDAHGSQDFRRGSGGAANAAQDIQNDQLANEV